MQAVFLKTGIITRLSFPGATYYIQERELNFAFEKGLPSFIPEELHALKNAQQVVLLDTMMQELSMTIFTMRLPGLIRLITRYFG